MVQVARAWVNANCRFAGAEGAISLPVMYHGSSRKYDSIQPGTMLTTDAAWAIGYATTMDPERPSRDIILKEGTVHVARFDPSNAFVISGSLHDVEGFVIAHGKGSRLPDMARSIHEESGYDAIVARSRGEIVGAINLVDIPVDDWLDPRDVLRDHYDQLTEIHQELAEREGLVGGEETRSLEEA